MKKKIIEITSIEELMEMGMSGGGIAGHAGHPVPKRHKQPSASGSSGQGQANHFKPKGKDCLLYTSPSPRDKRQSRMPSSA